MTKQIINDLDAGTDVQVLSPQISKYAAYKIASQKDEKPKVRIQKLKNEIIALVTELGKQKAINKPTINKYTNFTYKPKIHEATLKSKVDELKYIQSEWKSQAAQTRETGNISKKFTLKELKGLKDTVKQEKENTYAVYIKYNQLVETTVSKTEHKLYQEGEMNDTVYPFDQKNDFYTKKSGYTKIHVKEIINHYQEEVKGKHNIQEAIKKFVDYQMSYPYVVKVNVLNVNASKSVLSDSQYRWLGSEKDRKEQLKYFKAWAAEMGFKYHGYNLDLNNETEFECVPNALFKMYGNKDGRSRIPFIVQGGLDAVKTILNMNNPNSEKFEVEGDKIIRSIKTDFKGYTPDDILMFCNKFKIRCFGYDWQFKQFITNKNDNIKFNDDLKAFVFYMNDHHIYLIDDKEVRQSILHSNDKSDLISLMAKQREIKVSKRERAVDLKIDEWDTLEKTDIFITESGLVHNTFYKFLCKGDVYNNKIKMNESEGIVRFQYKNKNMIIYNPDYHAVEKTLTKLNPDLYEFKNQRLNTLAKEVLEKEFGGYALSTMNRMGDDIFHSEFMRNCQFNGWLSEPSKCEASFGIPEILTVPYTPFEMPDPMGVDWGIVDEIKTTMDIVVSQKKTNLSAYDYNKHYTSCLMGMDMEFGWPIYNVFDEVKKFDGKLKAGFYYVECVQVFPYRGNGWYDADLVSYGLKTGLITMNNVIYEYKASTVLPVDYFKKFIQYVYETFESPKDAINKLLGCFGHDYTNKNVHHFTTDGRLAFMEHSQNKDAQVHYIYHNMFGQTQEIDINNLDINKCISKEKPLCYHIYNTKEIKQFQNALPFFYKIYNTSAVQMHKMASMVGGIVRGIFTDTIIFENAVNKPPCDPSVIGGIRETNLKEFTKVSDLTPRKTTYVLKTSCLTNITDFKLEDNKGMYLTGLAGTGKSTKTNQIKATLKPEEFVVSASTHTSSLVVNGETIFNVFNINPRDYTYLKSTPEKLKNSGVKWVFVDEISMIPSKVWAVLRDIKKIYGFIFILSGDYGQLPAVEEKIYDVEMSDVFAELCDGQKMELTENWRAKNDPEFAIFVDDLMKAREGRPINFCTYDTKECRRSLCWTNRTRKTINSKWMLAEASKKKHFLIDKFKVFAGLPIIANETRTFKNKEKVKFEVKNNEQFTVTEINSDSMTISNDRLTFSIEHREFKYFDLAYCITVHKAQGQTYDFEYTIYEYKRFDKKLLYTAMSRSTQKTNIQFNSFGAGTLKKGWIYKITDPNNKIYIGKTSTSVEQRWTEHQECQDGSPLHQSIQLNGIEGWKCEAIKDVEYADDEELSIAETVQMIYHNSITQGYNTKLSVTWENLY